MVPDLLDYAREMRNQPTPPEKRLWKYLSRSQLGFKFRRQAVLGPFIVDFLCPGIGLVIEVDGDTHDAERDAWRDRLLAAQEYTTLRFTNRDVLGDIDAVLSDILTAAESLPQRRPHPSPSP